MLEKFSNSSTKSTSSAFWKKVDNLMRIDQQQLDLSPVAASSSLHK
jgi:hypothetical protein